MPESEAHLLVLILLVGTTIVLSILIKAGLKRLDVPALIGYLLLGFLFRCADVQWTFFSEEAHWLFEFLAHIGIIVLLFRVGLESNLAGLIKQLRHASLIWIGNVFFSGGLGYVAAYVILELGFITSLIIAAALTATSVGVSVGTWQEASAIRSSTGQLLIDVAEMDDISGVILMAFLFGLVPALRGEAETSTLAVVAMTVGPLLLTLGAFATFCVLFSRYLEQPLMNFVRQLRPPSDPVLVVVGIGFMIAALAGMLGFSAAIGAFFAGLIFSRDPQSLNIDASFRSLYELFSPFFFIGIGLSIDPSALATALGFGAILVVAATLGKVIGTTIPALITLGWKSSLLLGVSMVPRAEIAMIIMQEGHKLGNWAVPPSVFAAMAMVSIVTCVVAPLLVQRMLRQESQRTHEVV